MSDESVAAAALVSRVDELHSMPGIASVLLQLTRDPDFSIREVVSCLEGDPALVAKILRTVNSAHFGMVARVSSLQHAVVLLGNRSLRLLALTFGLIENLTRGVAAEVIHSFWRRSLTMASASRRLALLREQIDPGEAYATGLLADLGMLMLAQVEPTKYIALCRESIHNNELLEAERSEFGCGHPALAAYLLRQWGVPEELVEAIESHHLITREAASLRLINQAANLLADVLWTPGSPSVTAARDLLHRTHDLDLDGFIDLCRACQQDVNSESRAFRMGLGKPIDCRIILECARTQFMEAALETAIELDSLTALFSDSAAQN